MCIRDRDMTSWMVLSRLFSEWPKHMPSMVLPQWFPPHLPALTRLSLIHIYADDTDTQSDYFLASHVTDTSAKRYFYWFKGKMCIRDRRIGILLYRNGQPGSQSR